MSSDKYCLLTICIVHIIDPVCKWMCTWRQHIAYMRDKYSIHNCIPERLLKGIVIWH